MAIIRSITSEGAYNTLFIQGNNRNVDIGLKVHLEAHQSLTIKQLVIENTFVPLVKTGDGRLTIERLQLKDFGGDGINLRGNNLSINQLIVRNSTPTRPYHSLRVTAPTEQNIRAALQACNQQVYDWRLLQWLEVQENGQTFFYSPGYHSDIALQAYRPQQTAAHNVLQKNSMSTSANPSPLHLTPDQIQTVADSLFPLMLKQDSPSARTLMLNPSMLQLLDLVADTPHHLEVDQYNRIQSIDLLMPLNTPIYAKTLGKPSAEDLLGIADVTIRDVDIQTSDPNTQVFMLSESQRYRNFKIGTERLAINCRYPWWFVANTLENSVIGNAHQVQINLGQTTPAKVRIGDGQNQSTYCIKPSGCSTSGVTLVGLGHTGHAVPDTVRVI
ncbi:MAG: hypothetical protein E6Q85_04620 [Thiothrix sp.]|nr:MAG: hypothetical protein E6Q85_04620 [Thiothrix sp.]